MKELQRNVVDAIATHEEIEGKTDWQDDQLLGELFRVSTLSGKALDENVEQILGEVIQL